MLKPHRNYRHRRADRDACSGGRHGCQGAAGSSRPDVQLDRFYLGIEGGVGGANSQQTDTSGTTSGPYKQLGGLIGGTIGYNWQWSNFVAGVEADLSWADIGGLADLPTLCTAGQGAVCFTDMQWLNTDRVRLGMLVGAQNQFLLYPTGGVAAAGINSGQQSCSTPVPGAIASCGTKTE